MRIKIFPIVLLAILLIELFSNNSLQASASAGIYASFWAPTLLKTGENLVDISFTSVTSGDNFTCGITKGGDAYCWGEGAQGQLGNGSTENHSKPVQVSGGLTFASIDAGYDHACGITKEGKAYCWGRGRYGRLGNGSVKNQLEPVAVSGGLSFKAISAGFLHTCGIATDDKAYCWGRGQDGWLGNGSTKSQSEPVQVSGGISFASISVGSAHTCGISMDGRAYCWGSSDFGNLLGQGNDDSSTSNMVPSEVSGDLTFDPTSISVGNDHTCALLKNGQLYCWGRGRFGKLGTGSTDNHKTPVKISGDYNFTSISAGEFETCGLSGNGQVYCWGRNSSGQVGDNTTKMREKPVSVANKDGRTFANISTGSRHVCATTSNGNIYCWGEGTSGQLGNGSTVHKQVTPVRVSSSVH